MIWYHNQIQRRRRRSRQWRFFIISMWKVCKSNIARVKEIENFDMIKCYATDGWRFIGIFSVDIDLSVLKQNWMIRTCDNTSSTTKASNRWHSIPKTCFSSIFFRFIFLVHVFHCFRMKTEIDFQRISNICANHMPVTSINCNMAPSFEKMNEFSQFKNFTRFAIEILLVEQTCCSILAQSPVFTMRLQCGKYNISPSQSYQYF